MSSLERAWATDCNTVWLPTISIQHLVPNPISRLFIGRTRTATVTLLSAIFDQVNRFSLLYVFTPTFGVFWGVSLWTILILREKKIFYVLLDTEIKIMASE